jgi:lysophosphatidate acyltransferase
LFLVLPAIPTTGMTSADADALTTRVRDAMMEELIRLSHLSGSGNGVPLPRASGVANGKDELRRRTKATDAL